MLEAACEWAEETAEETAADPLWWDDEATEPSLWRLGGMGGDACEREAALEETDERVEWFSSAASVTAVSIFCVASASASSASKGTKGASGLVHWLAPVCDHAAT